MVLMSLVLLAQVAHGTSGPVPVTSGDWLGRSSLPLLRIKPLPALKDRALFKVDGHFYTIYQAPTSVSLAGPAYERDEQAVEAAIAFLKEHFDTSQYALVPTRIDHSSLGSAEPRSPDDRGHTIVLDAVFHGLILHGHGAVVYISGKNISMASVMLGSVAPVPDSERPVPSRSRAVAIWRDGVQKNLGATDAAPGGVSLQYVYSILANSHSDADDAYVLSPNWIIEFWNGSGELLVDGHEGRLWRND